MKKIIVLALALGSAAFIGNTYANDEVATSKTTIAKEQTVKYSIENMTCKMCDITVRKSMEKVDGVIKATVDYASKTAVVVFDPSKTDVKTIGMASTNAGYKATSI
jgi:mercuric ion binding protein